MKTKKMVFVREQKVMPQKVGILGRRSKKLERLEDLLVKCQDILHNHFGVVHVMTPGFNSKEVAYGGLVFDARQGDILRLQQALRRAPTQGMPGTIVLYKSHEQDSYYFIELKPYLAREEDELIKGSEEITRYLFGFLKRFYGG